VHKNATANNKSILARVDIYNSFATTLWNTSPSSLFNMGGSIVYIKKTLLCWRGGFAHYLSRPDSSMHSNNIMHIIACIIRSISPKKQGDTLLINTSLYSCILRARSSAGTRIRSIASTNEAITKANHCYSNNQQWSKLQVLKQHRYHHLEMLY
jgi:hypothetical protein